MPSFVTIASEPVSAMRKFAPEMPMSAAWNFGRSSARAVFTSFCTSSWSCARPVAFSNSSATCPRERWIAGITMCDGRSLRNCTIHSPRSVSFTSIPAASRCALRPISSAVMDFDLTILRTSFSLAMAAMISRASAASFARCTTAPRFSASARKRSYSSSMCRAASSFTSAMRWMSPRSSTSANTRSRPARYSTANLSSVRRRNPSFSASSISRA